MRTAFLVLFFSSSATGQHTLFAAANNAKGYVVGAKLAPSGVFRKLPSGEWRHAGFNHPFTAALAANPGESGLLYLAAGNGLIQLTQDAERWRILTGSNVTELRDVTVGPRGTIYFTHTRGIAASTDSGRTWQDISGDLRHRYSESIRVDRAKAGVLVAATENGLYRSENGGAHWKLAGAEGMQVLRMEQSPVEDCRWLATTELGGLFASQDCAKTFESVPWRFGVDRSLYDLAWDSLTPHRVGVAGFYLGVAISDNDGETWTLRNHGLPSDRVWSIAFDPDHKDRLYASVHEEAVYVSEDAGKTWKPDGLPGSAVSRFLFAPSGSSR